MGTDPGRHRVVDTVGDVAVLHHHHSGDGFHLPRDDCGGRKLASRTADRRCRLFDADRAWEPHSLPCGEPGGPGASGEHARPTHRRDSCRDNGGCGVCNVCVCGPYAASVGRRHLRSSDLGSNRACHPHHLGADLHSVSGVRAAVVSVLGMVPGDDYLLALCRDRRSGAPGLLRCRNLLHHELGECQPGHAELHRRGLVDDRRRALVRRRDAGKPQVRGARFDARYQHRSGGSGLMGMATTAGTVAATGGAAAAKAGAGGIK